MDSTNSYQSWDPFGQSLPVPAGFNPTSYDQTHHDQTHHDRTSCGFNGHLVLAIDCSALPQWGGNVVIEPKVFFPSSVDVGEIPKALATSRWCCELKKSVARISLYLKMLDYQPNRSYPDFQTLHRVSYHKGAIPNIHGSNVSSLSSDFMSGGAHKSIIDECHILSENDTSRYAFYLVLSTLNTLPPVLLVSTDSVVPTKPNTSVSFKEACPKMHETMLRLLKDPRSANVAFVFTIHNCQRKVGLWANLTFLDKYPRFQDLLDNTNAAPVIAPIEGISLTTFCVLLKYLYTEDVDLNIDPSQYLLCDMDHKPWASSSTVLSKSLKEYNAAQFYATWNVKDKVTWSDLFLAADRFEIADLRQLSLDKLLESVNKDNAVEILFGVGMCFKEEIRDPVMKYISENLDDGFSIQTHDPFKQFTKHDRFPEVMLELLRLSRAK